MHRYQKRVLWLVIVTAVLLTVSLVAANGELLPRSLISSAGGSVSQGQAVLLSAIGQPVVGSVGGVAQNGLTLCSGFLCAPDAPPLSGNDFQVYIPFIVR